MEKVEVWKNIPEYEGLYQVSNFGRVKSLKGKEKILKQCKNRDGYLVLNLFENGKRKHFKVHQIVALAFIPNNNPTEKTEINHIDENKENNHVDNLEWCTHKYNVNYGNRIERFRKSISIPILQHTLSGEFIREWDSAKTASKELNIDSSSIIKCLKGKRNKCGGFLWKYKD